MKIAISAADSRDRTLLLQIKKIMESLNIDAQVIGDSNHNLAREVDLVLAAGGDKGLLDYFHKVVTDSAPVIGVYESDSTGFLAQLDIRELESAILRLKKGDFQVDEVFRLAVRVDGREVQPVLNDVAVFSSKSAILMEHVLEIDDKDVWHDNSDGVIIATPTGSTAYSMSAGGPMVLQRSAVFLVVSVNSVDNTRRPLVVPNDTVLKISNIMSRFHCDVVLDGGSRFTIRKELECRKHPSAARFARLKGDSSAISLITKKVKLAEDMLSMPPSAKLILKTLEYEGAMSQKDLSVRTMLPERTIRLSLSHLVGRGYVKRKTSLRDARQRTYELTI
ncbi:MAG TPA: sugar kinase [Candidatus Nitrosopolaris sp.]|nr:sugar kinase [Candidatus Nitrosopolaris sp.]